MRKFLHWLGFHHWSLWRKIIIGRTYRTYFMDPKVYEVEMQARTCQICNLEKRRDF